MKLIIIIVIVTFVIVFLISILFIIKKSKKKYFNSIDNIINKTNDEISSYLNSKQELENDIIELLDEKIKIDKSILKDIKKDLSKKYQSFEKDNVLEINYKKLLLICEDYINKDIKKDYNEIITKIEDINIHLIALRTFYNKYVTIYNDLLNKKIYKAIAKSKKCKMKKFYEEKVINNKL